MVQAAFREVRRHVLRFIADTPDGEENSRIVYQQLLDVGHRLVWTDFDQVVAYLERAGCITVRWLHPEIDRTRILRITQRGYDVVQGTVADAGILPPAGGGAV